MMKEDTSLLILSGGRGSRLGGVDKGLFSWQGKALIEHCLDKLAGGFNRCFISCNRNFERYRIYGHPLLQDSSDDFPGPLAGIGSAHGTIQTPFCFICACDMPRLDLAVPERLYEHLIQTNASACHASVADRHNLAVLCHQKHLNKALQQLMTGKASVRAWLTAIQSQAVSFDDCGDKFENVNGEN